MGTIRREVNWAFAAVKKLLNTPLKWPKWGRQPSLARGVGQKPVVQGFTPYFYAPYMEARLRHAERATERWFQELIATMPGRKKLQYRRPKFYQRTDTDLHYIHKGHRDRPKKANRHDRRHGKGLTPAVASGTLVATPVA